MLCCYGSTGRQGVVGNAGREEGNGAEEFQFGEEKVDDVKFWIQWFLGASREVASHFDTTMVYLDPCVLSLDFILSKARFKAPFFTKINGVMVIVCARK